MTGQKNQNFLITHPLCISCKDYHSKKKKKKNKELAYMRWNLLLPFPTLQPRSYLINADWGSWMWNSWIFDEIMSLGSFQAVFFLIFSLNFFIFFVHYFTSFMQYIFSISADKKNIYIFSQSCIYVPNFVVCLRVFIHLVDLSWFLLYFFFFIIQLAF